MTFRNIALLFMLGTVSDGIAAAELALHAWYSAFVPTEYELRIASALQPILEGTKTELEARKDKKELKISLGAPLGPTSSFSGMLSPNALLLFCPIMRNQLDLHL